RLGPQGLQQALIALEQDDFATTAALALRYYDRAYAKALQQRPAHLIQQIPLTQDTPGETARQLLTFALNP
ncbi:MAG: tRNA 2-selenouridine(34) synthase MnmH, partial [Bacteroidota bacterium]